jgi:predicted membrane protein
MNSKKAKCMWSSCVGIIFGVGKTIIRANEVDMWVLKKRDEVNMNHYI